MRLCLSRIPGDRECAEGAGRLEEADIWTRDEGRAECEAQAGLAETREPALDGCGQPFVRSPGTHQNSTTTKNNVTSRLLYTIHIFYLYELLSFNGQSPP